MHGEEARLLVMGDIHFTTRPPRGRRPDYAERLEAKLAYVARAAADLGAVPVCTGDIFHRKEVEPAEVTRLIRAFRRFPGGYVWSVLGNHDSGKVADASGTAYETLVEAGAVRDLSGQHRRIGTGSLAISLTGSPYVPEADAVLRGHYNRVTDPRGGYEVRVTHGMLVDSADPRPYEATYASVATVPNPPDLLVNGHNHLPFDGLTRGAQEWCAVVNVGSLARVSRAEDGPRSVLFVRVDPRTLRLTFRRLPLPVEADVWCEENEERLDRLHAARREADERAGRVDAFADAMRLESSAAEDPERLVASAAGDWSAAARAEAAGYVARARDALA